MNQYYNISAKYLEQKQKYAERYKYMMFVFRSLQVNAANSKTEKYKTRMVELKISESRLEKLNKVFETEMLTGKEFNKIMNNKI